MPIWDSNFCRQYSHSHFNICTLLSNRRRKSTSLVPLRVLSSWIPFIFEVLSFSWPVGLCLTTWLLSCAIDRLTQPGVSLFRSAVILFSNFVILGVSRSIWPCSSFFRCCFLIFLALSWLSNCFLCFFTIHVRSQLSSSLVLSLIYSSSLFHPHIFWLKLGRTHFILQLLIFLFPFISNLSDTVLLTFISNFTILSSISDVISVSFLSSFLSHVFTSIIYLFLSRYLDWHAYTFFNSISIWPIFLSLYSYDSVLPLLLLLNFFHFFSIILCLSQWLSLNCHFLLLTLQFRPLL